MTNHFRRILSVVVCVLLVAHMGAGRTAGQRGKKVANKYPLSCAGIRVGTSTDEDILLRYGKGYFVKEEGHTGGRYYVDTRHQVMMHVERGSVRTSLCRAKQFVWSGGRLV